MLTTTTSLDNVNEQIVSTQNGHNGHYNSTIFKEIDDYITIIIKQKYLSKDKIGDRVASYYKLVLSEYFTDLIHAHNKNTLPQYFKNTHRDFIPNADFHQHKTRIEYLVKNCKNKLIEIISEY